MKRYDITLIKLVDHKKKYKVVIKDRVDNTKKTVSFGASSYEHYIIHKNKDRKNKYILRHQKNEDWNDIYSAGFWSRWLLWNKKTLQASIKYIEKENNCKITTQ